MPDEIPHLLHTWADAAMRRSMAAINQFKQEKGYSSSQINTLFFLRDRPNATVNDLSQRLGITKAAVSQLVNLLVDQNLVHRQEDPADRRIKRLNLTSQGHAELRQAQTARHAWLDALDATLSPAQKASLEPGLKILIEAEKSIPACSKPTTSSHTGS